MRKMMYFLLLAAAMMTTVTACSSEDPFLSDDNGTTTDDSNGNSDNTGGTVTTSVYADMSNFSIATDKTTTEPASTAKAAYPEGITESSKDAFGTVVNIDMSNPTASTENGVTITVDGNDVIADHGKTEGICYVVTGTTTDGSLTIEGKADYEVNLNNADITNTRSTALDLESKNNAFVVLTGSNKLTDGITADDSHKGALFGKGILLFSGNGSWNGSDEGIHWRRTRSQFTYQVKADGAKTLRLKGFAEREAIVVSLGDKQLGTVHFDRQGIATIQLPADVKGTLTLSLSAEQGRQTPRISEVRLCK